jgi:hypothetical protein
MKTIQDIQAIQLETLYRVMMLRMAKGYTAEQLNYLIGAPYHFVEDVESLLKPPYTGNQLDRITEALGEGNPESFFPLKEDETVLKIAVYKESDRGKIGHTYYQIDENGNEEELFRLLEDEFPDEEEIPNFENTLQLVKDLLTIMYRSGYFAETRMPYEIFHKVNSLLTVPVSPYFIDAAMQNYTAEDNGELLRMVVEEDGVFRYEEC